MAKKKIYRCRVETSVLSDDLEYSRAFGKGQLVDLGEILGKDEKGKAIKLGELVRADCFEEIDAAELKALEAEHDVPADEDLEEKTEGENK